MKAEPVGRGKDGKGDPLGVERTALANERTLLAYVRTALAFLIAGASVLRFFDSRPYEIGGAVGLAVGAVVFAMGFVRFAQVRARIQRIEHPELLTGGEDDGE